MKLVILNRKDFQDHFPKSTNTTKSHSEIHQDLFNYVRNNFDANNIIEVHCLIPYSQKGFGGDAVFRFEGKNKDIFFFTFMSTAA